MDEQREFATDNAIDAYVCECSEEYGPCEDHATLLVNREGASTRTADALAYVFLDDVATMFANGALDVEVLTAEQWSSLTDMTHIYGAGAEWTREGSDGWLDDPDVAQALHDDVTMVETWLPEGVWVMWEDGYRIVRVHDDCPLRADADDDDDADEHSHDQAADDAVHEAYEQVAREYR